jgi:hypothetical protein
VPENRRLLVQPGNDLGGVIGDLSQSLLGEDFWVRPRTFDRFRIIWPARRQRDVPGLLEQRGPALPARGQ